MAEKLRILVVILLFAACSTGGVPVRSDSEVRAAEERRFEAMTRDDVGALDRMLSDDLVYVHSSAQVESKQQFLANIQNATLRYKSIKPSAVLVRVYGLVAVVTGEADVVVSASGAERPVRLRYTSVYRRAEDNRWVLVSWQSTRIAS